jgi:hypothetical protein
MLDKVRDKISGTELEPRVTLHRCEEDRIGLTESVDFVLAFYMVHELPDQDRFYREIASLLTRGGQALVVEPPFHVTRKKFAESLERAGEAGFALGPGPKVFFCKTALLTRR